MEDFKLPPPNVLPLEEGLDIARTVLPEGCEFSDHYLEADYTFIFPFDCPEHPDGNKGILVVKPTKAVDIIDLN